MNDIIEIDKPDKGNPYDKLLPEAVAEVQRIMHFSDDEKLRLKASEDVIALSSHGKQSEVQPIIQISNSNVQLLMKTMKEVTGD